MTLTLEIIKKEDIDQILEIMSQSKDVFMDDKLARFLESSTIKEMIEKVYDNDLENFYGIGKGNVSLNADFQASVSITANLTVRNKNEDGSKLYKNIELFNKKHPIAYFVIFVILTYHLTQLYSCALSNAQKILYENLQPKEYVSASNQIFKTKKVFEENNFDMIKLSNLYVCKKEYIYLYNGKSRRSRTSYKFSVGEVIVATNKYKGWLEVSVYDGTDSYSGWVQSKYFSRVK